MKADWSSSAALPLEPVGGEDLVPVVADPAAGPAVAAAARPGPSGWRGSRRRTARRRGSASRPAAGGPSPSVRPSRPTYTGSGSSALTMRPRHRSRPKRRRVRRRAVSRWISRSRSSACLARRRRAPGARRRAGRTGRRSSARGSRRWPRSAASSPAIRAGSALGAGGREGRRRWSSGGSRGGLRPEVLVSASDSAARPGSCRKTPGALYVGSGRRRGGVLPFSCSSRCADTASRRGL